METCNHTLNALLDKRKEMRAAGWIYSADTVEETIAATFYPLSILDKIRKKGVITNV